MVLDKRQRRPLSTTTLALLASLPQQNSKDLDRAYSKFPTPPKRFEKARQRRLQLGISKPLCSPPINEQAVQPVLDNISACQFANGQPSKNDGLGPAQVAVEIPVTLKKAPLKTYSKTRSIVASQKIQDEPRPGTPGSHDELGILLSERENDSGEGSQQRPFKQQCLSRLGPQGFDTAKGHMQALDDGSEVNPAPDHAVRETTGSSQCKPKRPRAPKKRKRLRRLPVDELVIVPERLPDSDLEAMRTVWPTELSDDPIFQLSEEEPARDSSRRRGRGQKVPRKYQPDSIFGHIDISEFRLPRAGDLSPGEIGSTYFDGFEGTDTKPIGLSIPGSEPRKRHLPKTPVRIGRLTLVAEREFGGNVLEDSVNRRKRPRRKKPSYPPHVQRELQHSSESNQESNGRLEQQTVRDLEHNTFRQTYKEPQDIHGENSHRPVHPQQQSQSIPHTLFLETSGATVAREILLKPPAVDNILTHQPKQSDNVMFSPSEDDPEKFTRKLTKKQLYKAKESDKLQASITQNYRLSSRAPLKTSKSDEVKVLQQLMMVSVPRPVDHLELDDTEDEEMSSQGLTNTGSSSYSAQGARGYESGGSSDGSQVIGANRSAKRDLSSSPCEKPPQEEIGLSQGSQPLSANKPPIPISSRTDIARIEQPNPLKEYSHSDETRDSLRLIATQAIGMLEEVDESNVEAPSPLSLRNGTQLIHGSLSSGCESRTPSLKITRCCSSPELGMENYTAYHTQASVELGETRISDTNREIPETQFEDEREIPESPGANSPESTNYFTRATQDPRSTLPLVHVSRSRSTLAKFYPASMQLEDLKWNPPSSMASDIAARQRVAPNQRITTLYKIDTEAKVLKAPTRKDSLNLGSFLKSGTRRMMTLPFAPPFKKPIGGSQSTRGVGNGYLASR